MTEETLITDTANNTEGVQQQDAKPAEAAEASTQQNPDTTASQDGDKQEGSKAEGDDKPTAPEKYDFKFPEGTELDPAFMGEFENVAKEIGLSQENAQKLADFGPKLAQKFADKQAEVFQAAQAEWHEQSLADKEFGGAKYSENLAVAKKALDTLGTPELRTLLEKSGLQKHPEVIRLFYKAGKRISEDSMVTGGNTTSGAKDPAEVLYGKTSK